MSELLSVVGAGGGGGGGCFRAGTKVQLEHGKQKSIDELREGDEILSFDECGDLHVSKVTKLHIHKEPQPILKVSFWRGHVHITPNHWVLNQYSSFVEIQTLSTDDALVDGMGHLRPITSAELVASEPVYNLTVEPNHTFIADGIRVHNGGHREAYPVVTGSGGGGGGDDSKGEGGRAAIEDPDSLRSRGKISIVDLIGEGEIGGLINGAKSIFLNETPLLGDDGVFNFTNVSWNAREGTPNQSVIPGFSDVESPTPVGVEVTKQNSNVFTVSNPNVDRVRVVISIPSLMIQDKDTGDLHGTSVTYAFFVNTDGAGDVQVGSNITVTGKTRSKYQRSHIVNLPKPGTSWQIRTVRITEDSVESSLANKTWVDSYVEIVDVKLNYPNSALATVTVDPETFSSVPTRSYLVKGLYIQVPSNYDAGNKTYNGIWDGNLIVGVSSNPAWVLYDLLINNRYGLGRYLTEDMVDKVALYKIGQYCDDLVEGYNGLEPRFTINTAIQTQAEAYKLISDITSVFRGMSYWGGGLVNVTQDSPLDPSMVYGQANVVDGVFTYTGSARKNRHSVVLVTWNDPLDNFKQRVEYVDDYEQIELSGIKKHKVIAFGCTSRGQANRVGKWILYTEKYESNLINFRVGLDSSLIVPGEVVKIHDTFRAGKRMSGRLLGVTDTSATVDDPVTLASTGAVITLKMSDGSLVDRAVSELPGDHSILTWVDPLIELPVDNSMFMVAEASLKPMLARIISISQVEGGNEFDVVAVEHNPIKYDAIESGALIEDAPTSVIDPFAGDPSNISFDETTYFIAPGIIGSKLNISWEGLAAYYEFSYRTTSPSGSSNWQTFEIRTANYEIMGLRQDTTVDVTVVSTSTLGKKSRPLNGSFLIAGKTAPPAVPTSLTATPLMRSALLKWINPSDIDFSHTEVYFNTSDDNSTAVNVAKIYGDTYTYTGLPPAATLVYFWVKAVDTSGNKSEFNAVAGVSTTTLSEADAMVASINGSIGTSTLNAELGARIDLVDAPTTGLVSKVGSNTVAVATQQSATDGISAKYTVKIDNNGYVSGYGLISEENDGAVISEFGVRADKFFITDPAGPGASSPIAPFMVLTTQTDIDGTLFDPGVYIDNAMITKLTADKIDTRGLSIRDVAGNVILSSGNPLDYTSGHIANTPTGIADINEQEGLLLSSIASDFSESFHASSAIYNWASLMTTSATVSIESSLASSFGGEVLTVVDDVAFLTHKRTIPFDQTRQYRVRCRVRRVSGVGTISIGFVGVAANGTTGVNINGSSALSFQHYHTADNESPSSVFTEYVGYTTGFGATLGDGDVGTESVPSKMHPDVRYIRPLLHINQGGAAGSSFEIDSFIVESISGAAASGTTWGTLVGRPLTLTELNQTEGDKLATITQGADVTSSNTAAGIAGQGAFSLLDKIPYGSASTWIADAAIGASQIGSIALVGTSNFSFKSSSIASEGRIEMDGQAIKVFDTGGALRVQLGNLSA